MRTALKLHSSPNHSTEGPYFTKTVNVYREKKTLPSQVDHCGRLVSVTELRVDGSEEVFYR